MEKKVVKKEYFDMYAGRNANKLSREDLKRINGVRHDAPKPLKVMFIEVLIAELKKVEMLVKSLTNIGMKIDPDVDLGYKISKRV